MKTKQILIKAVKGAISIIQNEASIFTHKAKDAYDLSKSDLVTSADLKAQEYYLSLIRANFPEYGIIAEENELHDLKAQYFALDPLDGTKAFARGQSHGVGTMIAMVDDYEVIAAYVGDVNTGEIYGYAPEQNVTRTRFGVESHLAINPRIPLNRMYSQLVEPIHRFPIKIQRLIKSETDGGIFKDYEIMGGSIGTNVARLWKGEIGALFLTPGHNTPWDNTPLIGINKKLGIKHIHFNSDTGHAEVFEPQLVTQVEKSTDFEILVHESHLEEILQKL